MRHHLSRLFAAFCVAVCACPAAAQMASTPVNHRDARTAASGEISALGFNVLLGGVTAASSSVMRRQGVLRAFARGAAGGAVAYAGKRVAVERWPGAGLVGRQIHGVGGSEIANAAAGRPVLAQVVLAAGPVHFYVDRQDGWTVQPRLDVVAVGALAHALTRDDLIFDVGQSLSAGAPLFHRYNDRRTLSGKHVAGMTRIVSPRDEWKAQSQGVVTVAAHERVHVLQRDMALIVVGAPAQRRIAPRIPGGRTLDRFLDLGLQDAVWVGLRAIVPYEHRPWERESYFLSERPADRAPVAGAPGQR